MAGDSFTTDRSIRSSFGNNTYGDSNVSRDVYAAPDLSQFNNRTFSTLLQNAGINTNNPYGTGGQWASQQEAPMYWLMRARMALAPSQYGQENDPNAVGNYFNGGQFMSGSGGTNGYGFLANPNAGQGDVSSLLGGNQISQFTNALNSGNAQAMLDPSMNLLNEWNQNPSQMGSALSSMLTSGMAGDAAKAMSSFLQNVIDQVINNPQAMQGSNPVAAVASKLGYNR